MLWVVLDCCFDVFYGYVQLVVPGLRHSNLNVKEFKSTMVPSALMDLRGKKEHFSILRAKPSAADSYTMRIDIIIAESKPRCAERRSSM